MKEDKKRKRKKETARGITRGNDCIQRDIKPNKIRKEIS